MLSVREGEQGEVEVRRMVRYPDAHQLFVGNVPHAVDKSELKEFFERKSCDHAPVLIESSLRMRWRTSCTTLKGLRIEYAL